LEDAEEETEVTLASQALPVPPPPQTDGDERSRREPDDDPGIIGSVSSRRPLVPPHGEHGAGAGVTRSMPVVRPAPPFHRQSQQYRNTCNREHP
jgi:hypothetical protein